MESARSRLSILLAVILGAGLARGQDPRSPGSRDDLRDGLRARLEADLAAHRAGDLPREALIERVIGAGAPLLPVVRERLLDPSLDPSERALLVGALPLVAPPAGEEVLASLIDSPLRNEALAALEAVGTASSADVLLACFGHERPSVRVLAAQALGSITARDASLAARLGPVLRHAVQEARTKAADLQGAAAALEALTTCEGAAALADLLPCLRVEGLGATALRLLMRADRDRPEWAEDRVSFVGPEEVRQALEELALDEQVVRGERTMALQALRVWGTYDTIPPLLELLGSPSRPVTEQAHEALRAITGQDLPGLLEWTAYWEEVAPIWAEYEALLETIDGRYAGETELALLRLGRIRDRRTFVTIERLFADGVVWADPAARADALAACQALAQLRDPRGAGLLIDLLAPEVPPDVRRQATWALGVIAGRSGPAEVDHWRRVFPRARPRPDDDPVAGADEATAGATRAGKRPRRTLRLGSSTEEPSAEDRLEDEEGSHASGE